MPARTTGELLVAGADQFTGTLRVRTGTRVAVTVRGHSGTHTVTLQRQFPSVGVWRDVEQYTADTASTYVADERQDIRFGIKTGDYTSGNSTIRLGRG